MQTIRIAMWSGPRNISTAMMRAWDARPDTVVMDEPFYGAYLAETGLDHPMRDLILAAHETDWRRIARTCAKVDTAPIVFQKHMCQHMTPEAPLDWMTEARHAFLIRPPEEVAASFSVKWDGMRVEDLGFHRQGELYDHVAHLTGSLPAVIEAQDVLSNPEGMLRALCTALDVPYLDAMLSWPPGPRETDGVWAAHWYGSVEGSTGFAAPRAPTAPDPALAPIIAGCRPAYEKMVCAKLSPLS